MKIAFSNSGIYDHEDYKTGDVLGTEYQVFGVAKEFVKRGHEVYIIRRWNSKLKEEVIEGVKIVNIDPPLIKKSAKTVTLNQLIFSKYASKEIRRIKPDILNLTGKYSSFFLSKINIPIVHTTHILPMDLLPQERTIFFDILRKIHPTKFLESGLYTNCNTIVALNKAHMRYLSNRGFNVVFIPNGIALENYIPTYRDEGYIYFAGRLVNHKGVQCLLESYSLLPIEIKDRFGLIISGFGPERKNLEDLTLKFNIKDKVEFLPWLSKSEFIEKIANCSVYVLPSFFEGLPVVLLESMALAKPIVASNIPGIQEVITHGENGFLFPSGDILKLKENLQALLENVQLRQKFGAAARERVINEYNFGKIADIYLKLYEKILK